MEFKEFTLESFLGEMKDHPILREVSSVHIHHTYRPRRADFDGGNHQVLQNGMRNYHVNVLGWSDIAQHLTIFPDGKILKGRDFELIPVSMSYMNNGAFAIEMVGDYDKGNDVMSTNMWYTVIGVTAYLMKKHGAKCIFHREGYDGKTCPGSAISKEAFMWGVNNWLFTGTI